MRTATTPQLIFHIGDPKTGTSSIQAALHRKIVTCDTHRILPWKKLNAVGVGQCLKEDGAADHKTRFTEVRDWLEGSDADLAVISSEFFARVRPNVLSQVLAEHLPDQADSTRVIAYVRPHASRYLAAYVQRTKTGAYLGDFDDFFQHIHKSGPLKYTSRFGRWQKVFADRFTLRPFIRSELRDGDIVNDFFTELLQGAPFVLSESVQNNIGVTLPALAGLRLMHCNLKEAGVSTPLRSLLGGAMANFFLPMGKILGAKPELDRETARILIQTYGADARAMDEAFFSGPLLETSLNTCVDKTAERPIDLTVSTYFSAAEEKRIIALSTELARLILKNPKKWAMFHRARKGEVILSDAQRRKLAREQRHLDAIDRHMREISEILRGSPALAGS